MSRVPLGAAVRGDFGRPTAEVLLARYEMTSQFEGAERIADKWGVTREDCDRFGLRSRGPQRAWAEGRFEREVRPVERARRRRGRQAHRLDAPVAAGRGPARRRSRRWPSSKPVGARTACTPPASSSQISDGAAAVLLMTAAKANGARA